MERRHERLSEKMDTHGLLILLMGRDIFQDELENEQYLSDCNLIVRRFLGFHIYQHMRSLLLLGNDDDAGVMVLR